MEVKFKKETKFIDNVAYKNKFQFQLWINNYIILQRYFKINGFVDDSIYSEEFSYCMNQIVDKIQKDLKSKSNIFMWYTNYTEPLKLNGFVKDLEAYNDDENFIRLLTNPKIRGEIKTPDGKIINKEYVDYTPESINDYGDTERPRDGEFVFKFSFLIDDVPVYEKIWDGNVYPKYIRNGVDLTNYMAQKEEGFESNFFAENFNYALQRGKTNLINEFIHIICETLSNTFADKYEYNKEMVFRNTPVDEEKHKKAVEFYGGVIRPEITGHVDVENKTRKYTYYSAYKAYEKSWKKKVAKKTAEYRSGLYA